MGNFISQLFPARKDGTAMGVAKYRQMELTHPDKSKLLFIDPYAYMFVTGSSIITWFGYEYCKTQSDKIVVGMWESLICRQLFIDNEMIIAVEEDKVEQIVILGAGYDCRFYRLDAIRKYGDRLTLIEVDQPEVQTLKKEGLKKLGIIGTSNTDNNNASTLTDLCGNEKSILNEGDVESYTFTNQEITEDLIEQSKKGTIDFTSIPKDDEKFCVQFCPCNFETMNFKDQLLKTTFDSKKKTLFLLEGLSQYVNKDSLGETVQMIHQVCDASGSKILLSYVDSRVYDDDNIDKICGGADGGEQMKKVLDMLVDKKEPWITGFNVDEENGTFEMEEWLSKNTDGSFCKDYVDQSWDEFKKNDLIPKGRDVYEFGKSVGEPLQEWKVERHVCITRK